MWLLLWSCRAAGLMVAIACSEMHCQCFCAPLRLTALRQASAGSTDFGLSAVAVSPGRKITPAYAA